MKSCCTLSSRSRRVSSIASPPSGLAQPRPPTPGRRRAHPPRAPALASRRRRRRRAFRVPAPLRAPNPRSRSAALRASSRSAEGWSLRERARPLCGQGGKLPFSKVRAEAQLLLGRMISARCALSRVGRALRESPIPITTLIWYLVLGFVGDDHLSPNPYFSHSRSLTDPVKFLCPSSLHVAKAMFPLLCPLVGVELCFLHTKALPLSQSSLFCASIFSQPSSYP